MNILKICVLVLSILVVTGCNQLVDQKDFKGAGEFCKDKEGVYQIVVVGTYGRQYHCKNGDFKALVRED
tara:strand:+ start:4311 stop:4517 length:207 start_codon:yes stop_codon:yes gene_type:complete